MFSIIQAPTARLSRFHVLSDETKRSVSLPLNEISTAITHMERLCKKRVVKIHGAGGSQPSL